MFDIDAKRMTELLANLIRQDPIMKEVTEVVEPTDGSRVYTFVIITSNNQHYLIRVNKTQID